MTNQDNDINPTVSGRSIPLVEGDDPISRMEQEMGCRFEEADMNNQTTTALMGMMTRALNGQGNLNDGGLNYAAGVITRDKIKNGDKEDLSGALALMSILMG